MRGGDELTDEIPLLDDLSVKAYETALQKGRFDDQELATALGADITTVEEIRKSLQDLHEYHAATGNFQQVVDLHQDSGLPDALLGSRTLYIAYGSVDASVDFSNVDGDSVDVSDDRRTATITLPRPTLSPARIDPTRSYIYDQNEGALNKIGDIFSSNDHDQQQLNVLAVQKMNAAAQQGSGLIARARENTRLMLSSLLRALGFTTVNVVFEDEQT